MRQQKMLLLFSYTQYAKSGNENGFPRKDNWRRHMRNRHGEGDGNVSDLAMTCDE
jgi:hypothetical protein